jgi:hypothetical protein
MLARTIRQEKEIKGIQVGKEEVQLFLLADDMTLYIESLKESTTKLSELMSKLSNAAGKKDEYIKINCISTHFSTIGAKTAEYSHAKV